MTAKTTTLSHTEKQATLSIASLFVLRLSGLFMIIPVFSLYAHTLKNSTPFLIGIALGCYGLTQALLQIPFGTWSDRYGRKPVITLGLIIFALGSLCAALSPTIWGVIIGRCLQGAGAVGSATNALLADLTSEENRLKAMAVVGIAIGISFALAMALGPLFSSWLSVPGIFWMAFAFGITSLWILHYWVPSSRLDCHVASAHRNDIPLLSLLFNSTLLPLNIGILLLHAILMATFVVLPVALQNSAGLSEKQQWHLYLPVLLLAFISMAPLIIIANKKERTQAIFLLAIGLLALAELLIYLLSHSIIGIAIGLWLFFTIFMILEAMLPSLLSKAAPKEHKGKAFGVYSCCQFIGIFIGGSVGGWLYGHFQLTGVFLLNIVLCCAWLLYVKNQLKN